MCQHQEGLPLYKVLLLCHRVHGLCYLCFHTIWGSEHRHFVDCGAKIFTLWLLKMFILLWSVVLRSPDFVWFGWLVILFRFVFLILELFTYTKEDPKSFVLCCLCLDIYSIKDGHRAGETGLERWRCTKNLLSQSRIRQLLTTTRGPDTLSLSPVNPYL